MTAILRNLVNIYRPRIRQNRGIKYYDFNNNKKPEQWELITNNITAEQFLKNIIENEANIYYLKKTYLVLNDRKNNNEKILNKFESKIIAKACLISSGVPSNKIPEYLNKIAILFKEYQKYKEALWFKPDTEIEEIETIQEYLWKNGKNKYTKNIFSFDKIIDNQIKYFAFSKRIFRPNKIKVGNCVGLTALSHVFAIREGINVETAYLESPSDEEERHVLSKYRNNMIENTVGKIININEPIRHGPIARPNPYKDNITFTSNEFSIVSSIYYTKGMRSLKDLKYKKDLMRAKEYFEIAINLDPNNPIFYYSFILSAYIGPGLEYEFMGKYFTALSFYNKAYEFVSTKKNYKDNIHSLESISLRLTLIYEKIGNYYYKNKKYKKAKEAYKKAKDHKEMYNLYNLMKQLILLKQLKRKLKKLKS